MNITQSRLNRLRAAVLRAGQLRKSAAAVLTPEAEQAAVQPPQDPAMAQAAGMPAPGGMPPQDPAMAQGGGQPVQAAGPSGGQIPPEILQDQQFIMWLQQQGVAFDPQSGTFIDQASGQPLPADAIMQAYQMYQEQMSGAQGGATAPPAAAGGMPPQGGGQLPPEILQDQAFIDFMTQAMGAQFDGQQFMDPQSGQPIPPDLIMQAYQQFQQQMAGAQGGAPAAGMPPQEGAPADPAAGGMPPQDGGQLPPEILEQLQSTVDASLQNYTAQLDKKIETLLDKLETVKQAIESMRDTDDERDNASKKEAQALRDEIAAELAPAIPVKTASENSTKGRKSTVPRPINMLDLLRG